MKTTNWIIVCALWMSVPYQMAAQKPEWPVIRTEMKPGARWWWMGSAVDSANLAYNLKQYAEAGIGTMEITPIYGVQKNEAKEIPFLSEQWMNMYRFTVEEARKNGMQIDMNNGTGWPFGGPKTSIQEEA